MPVFISLTHCRRLFVRVLTGRRVTLRRTYGPPIGTPAPRIRSPRHGRVRKSVVIVVQGIGRVVLGVLQPGDQSLVFVSEFPSHEGRFPDDHHVLGRQREIRPGGTFFVGDRRGVVHRRRIGTFPFPPFVCGPLRFGRGDHPLPFLKKGGF